MPLPLILGIGAAVAGIAGIGNGIHGAVKMKEANDMMKSANSQHKRNLTRFEAQSKATNGDMDQLGQLELKVLNSFETFADVIEKIQNRPRFTPYTKEGITIPEYNGEKLREVSIGAGVLLGGLGGATVGTAGGFAAAGATTVAVMALGTASTGTAIASLSGAALTNATLAALGGGAIAAGGGGIALGTAVLGAATLGVGVLVGGIIFNITGSSLSNKADEAWAQMQRAEKEIDQICTYMKDLSSTANKYYSTLSPINDIYLSHLNFLDGIVNITHKTDWNEFTVAERLATENATLLVGLLYNMCKVPLVLQSKSEKELNTINSRAVEQSISDTEQVCLELGFELNA